MKGKFKFIFSAILCVLLLTACADSQVTDTTPTQEPAPTPVTLGVSDLDAILTSLDISNATITVYGEKVSTYSAGIAIRAGSYLAKLRDYTWEEYQVPDEWEENEGYRCQITAPGMTLTAFQSGYADARPLHVETDSGEGWFTLPYIEGKHREAEQVSWMLYDDFFAWYTEAQAAAFHGGVGIPLTAEELDWFQDYTAFERTYYDETWGGWIGEATAINGFFTSKYNDPRDIDAGEFLAYCPGQGELGLEDEAEFQLVQEKLDWRSGEDNHLFTVDELPVPCHRLPRTYINEILTRYAGITVEDMHTDWTAGAFYIPQTDCFYTFTSDFGPGSFVPSYGEKDGDIVTLWEAPNSYDDNTADVLTLQNTDDGYRILSHKPAANQ